MSCEYQLIFFNGDAKQPFLFRNSLKVTNVAENANSRAWPLKCKSSHVWLTADWFFLLIPRASFRENNAKDATILFFVLWFLLLFLVFTWRHQFPMFKTRRPTEILPSSKERFPKNIYLHNSLARYRAFFWQQNNFNFRIFIVRDNRRTAVPELFRTSEWLFPRFSAF